ncbi:heterokaryon incompatibility, partial [Rhexocercosporidium sp. MPI-PUGE-AT-0058]
PIEGHIEVINLDQDPLPKFAALSYVWGAKATGSRVICCENGGSRIPVTENCYSALVHLRRNIPGDFSIWIDAMCINQNDMAEKVNQISLMGDIYWKASTVYVWLGEGDPATDTAMRYLAKTGLLEYFDHDNILRAALTTHDDLRELLNKEWTQRIWTYQEIILATNPVM